ncbi:MAG: NADH-quinone oxidoreductase subunit L [Dehalococcoidia bacterium]|nr:NADH-quinone oxidoreductase subunit L [Dehalococcoidia bacterium]
MTEAAGWLIIGLPMASFVLIGLVLRPFLNRKKELAGYVTIGAIGGSFGLSIAAMGAAISSPGIVGWAPHEWLTVGNLSFNVGLHLDHLTAIMLVVVTSVSLLVQIYSQGYMKGDPGYVRYFALMSLFTASMLGLVMSRNIVMMYAFWELVGVSSYLLIGFWHHRPSASRAAVKAFLVTRLGDFGFLLAILYLFFHQSAFAAQGLNPLEIPDIYEAVRTGVLGQTAITWIAIGLFAGAAGKSAQFPLHTWLPDAMEGPTPVSALIHAATMVAAGVFLVARFFPLFEASHTAMNLVAVIGGVTAVFAATMGVVAKDIKRVVAYSTISQLGYMMLALGVGAYSAAIFHLFNHAFFKALLFLGSGSVNHATGTFNMDFMGGMGRQQRWTAATFVVASLSLAGIFPLAGFWSKDEILAEALHNGDAVALLVFALGVIGALMTAFYIFRAFYLTFTGKYRGGAEAEEKAHPGSLPEPVPAPAGHDDHGSLVHGTSAGAHGGSHLAESPWVMVGPMVVLALLAVGTGALFNSPVALGPIPSHWFSHFLVPPGGEFEGMPFNFGVAVTSLLVAAAGILGAWALYRRKVVAPESLTIKPVYQLIARRYYMDDLYEKVFTGRVFYGAACATLDWVDRNVVDGLADTVGWFGRNLGRAVAQIQTGQPQTYAMVFGIGVVLTAVGYILWG